MIGTQRSGSNLLRVMLNQLNEVAAPHPPHILQQFFPLLNVYGDLSEKENFYRLTDDVCRLVELNPVKWEGCTLNREELIKSCTDNSLVALFYAIYEKYAHDFNASSWICKSMANVNYLNEIESFGKMPLFIYLYRDGRDVACSFKQAIVGEKHIYHLAQQWKTNQEKCLKLKCRVSNEQFFAIKYEELIQEPEKVLINLCSFLNVKYDNKIIDYHQSNESKNTASAGEMWGNVTKPVMRTNFNKFLQQLSKDEIIIFEHIAGEVLIQLGYSLVYAKEAKKLVITDEMKCQFDEENELLKAETKSIVDLEGQKLREGQKLLLHEIKYENYCPKAGVGVLQGNQILYSG